MYDVHSHILPGLDDGAKTVEEFVAMARAAAAGGTTVMLATPHRRDVTENFRSRISGSSRRRWSIHSRRAA